MKLLGRFNNWGQPNFFPVKIGKLDRYWNSRFLQLEPLEGRITPATYTVFTNADSGTGSLRQAITDANLVTGPHTINFAITGSTGGIQTITLASTLPVILQPITIDGTSQPGFSANTLSVGAGNNAAIKIQLDGKNLTSGGEVGLYLNSGGSTVQGLSIVNFPYGIYANGDNITIKGNYFGVNADGSAQTNGLSGVGVDIPTFSSAIVGGNAASDQNIFGNLTIGLLQIAGSSGNFTGNRIGLGTTNTSFMANNTGIQINNNANVDALNHLISNNLIGKNTTGINLIGFTGATVPGTGKVIGTQISGNLIGSDSPTSTNNLGNSGNAISIGDGVTGTTIGTVSNPNLIAYSGQNAIAATSSTSVGNIFKYNTIRNNVGLGISLLNNANNGISPPVLTQQLPNGTGGFTYSGFVNGAPATTYNIDFYSSLITDSKSQGANYLGSTTVTTNSAGNIGFSGFSPTQNQTAQGAGYVVTATATNANFGTSQFSAGPPSQILVVSGNNQTTMIGTAFTNPLTARVVDSRGDPVPNIQVQFAAPTSNPPSNPATGTFPSSQQTAIAITNTVGIAASPTLTANNAPGNFTVLTSVFNNAAINPVSFPLTNTLPAPTITSVSPASGQIGTSVVISGTGFAGPTQVKFNGVTATNITVNSSTQITAMVPLGATTGPISVTTSGGSATSGNDFTVTSSQVSSFKVELANPGQQVIAGVPIAIRVSALNAVGGVVSNFTGPVNISTSDPLATIPSIINFTAANNGVVIFNAVFRTPGPATVTATFQGNGATGTGSGVVLQGSNGPFQVSSPVAPVPFPLNNSITKDLAILTGITSATLSNYVATISWGDGSPNSPGTIQPAPNQPGVFQVLGTHTYKSLEVFTGSVTVTRITDNNNSTSSFNAVVLTPAQRNQLNNANGSILPPGGQLADAGVKGINALYRQPPTNNSTVILVTASFIGNPQPYSTTLPAQNFYDVRLINPLPAATLSVTCSFTGGFQRGSSPYLQFAQDNSTSYQNVISANNLVVINYIDSTITVYLDQTSFPLINTLRGTVFAVVTNTTQVSPNTVTILPASFSGGTAVGIAWGASNTLMDIANASSMASNTTLTFQNSRQTTLSLAPSQSTGTIIFRTSNYGGTTNDNASMETINQLTNPEVIQNIIRGTIGIGPEVITGMIKKMLVQNPNEFLKQWSSKVLENKSIPNDIITPEKNPPAGSREIPPAPQPQDPDCSFLSDEVFDDISKIIPAKISEVKDFGDLGTPQSELLDDLAFAGEINWAGLALSTIAFSQFRSQSSDKQRPSRPIKISA